MALRDARSGKQDPKKSIRSAARPPLTQAAVGIASAILVGSSAHAQEGTLLPQIDVQAQSDSGYQPPSNTGITRLPTPLRNTPQTVNVIPQQVIQEQRAQSVEDTLRYVPGITFSAGEGGQQGDGPIIRGFVARGDLFRDGIRDPGWYTRDIFSSDRVEVYKGPSAFAFGRGSTGGAINTVTKLPTGAQFVDVTATATTGPGVRGEIDASTRKDNFSTRIAALGTDVDTPTRDNVWTQRWGVAPSVKWDINPETSALFSYIYQGERGAPDYGFTYLPQPAYSRTTGLPTNPGYYGNGTATTPLPVDRSNWYGIANGPWRDITETETHIVTLKLERQLNSDFKVVNATRYMTNDRFSLPTAPRQLGDVNNTVFGNPPPANYPVDLMTIGRERRQRETDNTFLINQTDLLGRFEAFGLSHTAVAGVEFSRETRDQVRLDVCDPGNPACRTSAAAPDPNGSPIGGTMVLHQPNSSRANTQAAYVSDQAKWQNFEFLGSLRFDRFASVYEDLDVPANRHLERTDNLWSYRFGVVYHPTPNSSVYYAYGNSHNPSAEQGTISDASVAALAPERTHSHEAGVKVDVLENRLSLTAAVFDIEKENLRITDPTNASVSILDGVARVRGIELGAAGRLTDKWQIIGGYSFLRSEITDTSDLSIYGRNLPNTPEHNVALWSTYDVAPQWTIGAGAIYQSKGWANTANTAYVPDFWKFDAMVAYRIDGRSSLQLNIYNITDELYYAQYFGNNVVPASGRWASLTYRIRW